MYSVQDVHRFLFDIPGDGEESDVENSSSDEEEGNVIVNQPEIDDDSDYSDQDLPSTSTAPSQRRGRGRGRARGRGRGGARRGVVVPVIVDLGPMDEHVNKEYPEYHGRTN